jgi:hypothetical protein
VISASNAWAVGSAGTSVTKTLILHWNGNAWSWPAARGRPCCRDQAARMM